MVIARPNSPIEYDGRAGRSCFGLAGPARGSVDGTVAGRDWSGFDRLRRQTAATALLLHALWVTRASSSEHDYLYIAMHADVPLTNRRIPCLFFSIILPFRVSRYYIALSCACFDLPCRPADLPTLHPPFHAENPYSDNRQPTFALRSPKTGRHNNRTDDRPGATTSETGGQPPDADRDGRPVGVRGRVQLPDETAGAGQGVGVPDDQREDRRRKERQEGHRHERGPQVVIKGGCPVFCCSRGKVHLPRR